RLSPRRSLGGKESPCRPCPFHPISANLSSVGTRRESLVNRPGNKGGGTAGFARVRSREATRRHPRKAREVHGNETISARIRGSGSPVAGNIRCRACICAKARRGP